MTRKDSGRYHWSATPGTLVHARCDHVVVLMFNFIFFVPFTTAEHTQVYFQVGVIPITTAMRIPGLVLR